MKSYYRKSNNAKVVVYAILLALVLGIGAVIVQDIEVPTDHVSETLEVQLAK